MLKTVNRSNCERKEKKRNAEEVKKRCHSSRAGSDERRNGLRPNGGKWAKGPKKWKKRKGSHTRPTKFSWARKIYQSHHITGVCWETYLRNSSKDWALLVVLKSVRAVLRDGSKHRHHIKGLAAREVEHGQHDIADKLCKKVIHEKVTSHDPSPHTVCRSSWTRMCGRGSSPADLSS